MSRKTKRHAHKRAKQASQNQTQPSQDRAAGAVVVALLDAMTFGMLEVDETPAPESRRSAR